MDFCPLELVALSTFFVVCLFLYSYTFQVDNDIEHCFLLEIEKIKCFLLKLMCVN